MADPFQAETVEGYLTKLALPHSTKLKGSQKEKAGLKSPEPTLDILRDQDILQSQSQTLERRARQGHIL